jgi:serine/threonine-protein kinase
MSSPDRPAKDARKAIRVGHYEVIHHIATGGMGAVYKARDIKLGREVALKIMSPELASNPTQLERFKREAKHAAKLRHENIVTLYELGEDKDTHYIAMELIEGIDLHEYISRKKKLDPEEARRILIQATRGLAHAHKQGLVHRDIKPSNFLIVGQKEKMVVKMTDLGLAREASDDESRMTRSGTTVGTVDYMAPEQARDSRLADTRSDIYSLGCTLYHMLAGQPPFPDGGLTERLYKHAEAEVPDVRQFNKRVPDALIAIMNRMLAKRPEDRYQTPNELLKELMGVTNASTSRNDPNVLAGLALAADEKPSDSVRRSSGRGITTMVDEAATTTAYRPPRKQPKTVETEFTSQRNPLSWVLLGGVGMLIGLAIVVAILILRQDKKPPETAKPPDKDTHGHRQVAHDLLPDERPQKKETKPPPVVVVPKTDEPRWLYKEAGLVKAAELRRQFEEPWKNDKPPAAAPILRVSRGPKSGPGRFNSLAAACAKAADGALTIIEIHDNGPLFEPAMQLSVKHLLVRAAPGYRPLIVWDQGGGASNPARSSAFFALRVGSLTLENVNVVCKWSDAAAVDSPVLFQLEDADFRASDCTFSLAGKHSAGLTAVRCDGSRPGQKCRLTRCFGRGPSLAALNVRSPGAETLVESCLFVGGEGPLLQVAGHDSPTRLRLAQSTLVTGQTLLRIGSAGANDLRPRPNVQVHAWDCFLSHAVQGDGELLSLADNVDSTSLQWQATNCLYAGWKNLLTENNVPLAWTDFELSAWHRRWNGANGDRAVFRAWPGALAHDQPEQPATAYRLPEFDKELYYPSTAHPDCPLGCDVVRLPVTRDNWESCTYDRAVPAAVTMITTAVAPPIPTPADGEYAGERLDLSKVDLGAHLKEVQNQGLRLATRVVLHLYASGDPQKTRPTAPIRVKDSSLVLYFEPHADKSKAPPVLLAADTGADDPGGFIDVEGGSLEIIGGEIRYPDLAIALLPAYMIKVRHGDLRMHACTLQGPLGQAPIAYRGLIRFDGASTRLRPEHFLLFGAGADLPFPGQLPWVFLGNLGTVPDDNVPTLGINECVFVSARNGIHLTGTGARLRVQESLIAVGGDAFLLEPGRTAQPSLRTQLSLENDTIAAKGAALRLGDAPQLTFICDPMLMWTRGVAFLGAFAGGSALLREDGDALARGWLVWQGEGDFYDKKRLHFYHTEGSAGATDPKSFVESLVHLWGSQGERKPAADATLAGTLSLEGYDRKQLERLALPMQAGGKTISAGADLVRLGIMKKRPK